jgi:hypothetical protein
VDAGGAADLDVGACCGGRYGNPTRRKDGNNGRSKQAFHGPHGNGGPLLSSGSREKHDLFVVVNVLNRLRDRIPVSAAT